MPQVPKPSHNRKAPKLSERSKFSKMVRDRVKEEQENLCQQCGRKGVHLHHVKPRSGGGRGVFTNALLLCNPCHVQIHKDNDLLKYWQKRFREMYGPVYYFDWEDFEQRFLERILKETDPEVIEWKKHNKK
jgi:hypothetical protein